jgi:hypothetical protein
MKLIRVGVDLAKNLFQVHGVDRTGKVLWRQRLPRGRWLERFLELTPGYINQTAARAAAGFKDESLFQYYLEGLRKAGWQG